MGGSRRVDWLDDLGAAFEAAEARQEEVAASDLAFSLRQDVDLVAAVGGRGWTLVLEDGLSAEVDEVGADYVIAGLYAVPASKAVLRAADGRAPLRSERSFAEWLGSACRAGATIEVRAGSRELRGALVTVGRDHLKLRTRGAAALVGMAAVDSVGLCGDGYSASRGFSG